jgi:hypothetical protein
MDELEAVNILLGYIGSDEVNDITIGHPDVNSARRTLDRVQKRLQRKRWWFNTDYNVTLSPEPVTKKIRVKDVHTVDVSDYHVVARDGFLYDRDRQSFQFDENITVQTLVRYITWENLPHSIQDAALFKAGAELVRDEIEDENKVRSLLQDYAVAMVDVNKENLSSEQYNMFAKPRVYRARQGIRPYQTGAVTSRFLGKAVP